MKTEYLSIGNIEAVLCSQIFRSVLFCANRVQN